MRSPNSSLYFMSHWVVTLPLTLASGTISCSGWSAMITPAACTPALRDRPSTLPASSNHLRFSGVASRSATSSGSSSSAWASVTLGPSGIFLATLSTSGSGTSSTRPMSRSAFLALSLPKVMIWQTFSSP